MNTNLPACHQDSPQHAAYVALTANLEYLASAIRCAEKILLKHPIPFTQ